MQDHEQGSVKVCKTEATSDNQTTFTTLYLYKITEAPT